MVDMLVKLYDIVKPDTFYKPIKEAGITIRRAIAPEKHIVTDWVQTEFGSGWASECDSAFSNHPVSCIIAVRDNQVIGFACYNATFNGAAGPIGVGGPTRMHGVGRSLLLASLNAMLNQGYAYAIVGNAGAEAFFAKTVGATPIEGSFPGPYKGMLKQ